MVGCNRRLPLVLAVLALLTSACERSQGGAAQPPPKVAVAHPVVRTVVDWDEYTGRVEAIASILHPAAVPAAPGVVRVTAP